jgi:hypothetical protein
MEIVKILLLFVFFQWINGIEYCTISDCSCTSEGMDVYLTCLSFPSNKKADEYTKSTVSIAILNNYNIEPVFQYPALIWSRLGEVYDGYYRRFICGKGVCILSGYNPTPPMKPTTFQTGLITNTINHHSVNKVVSSSLNRTDMSSTTDFPPPTTRKQIEWELVSESSDSSTSFSKTSRSGGIHHTATHTSHHRSHHMRVTTPDRTVHKATTYKPRTGKASILKTTPTQQPMRENTLGIQNIPGGQVPVQPPTKAIVITPYKHDKITETPNTLPTSPNEVYSPQLAHTPPIDKPFVKLTNPTLSQVSKIRTTPSSIAYNPPSSTNSMELVSVFHNKTKNDSLLGASSASNSKSIYLIYQIGFFTSSGICVCLIIIMIILIIKYIKFKNRHRPRPPIYEAPIELSRMSRIYYNA